MWRIRTMVTAYWMRTRWRTTPNHLTSLPLWTIWNSGLRSGVMSPHPMKMRYDHWWSTRDTNAGTVGVVSSTSSLGVGGKSWVIEGCLLGWMDGRWWSYSWVLCTIVGGVVGIIGRVVMGWWGVVWVRMGMISYGCPVRLPIVIIIDLLLLLVARVIVAMGGMTPSLGWVGWSYLVIVGVST